MSEIHYTFDRSKKIATFVIDTEGQVNTIGRQFVADLEDVCERAQADRAQGILIRSGKRSSFLDGANLKEIMNDGGKGAVRHLLFRFQEVLAALAQSPFPVVAILDDQTALGGGMELLLWACDHVVATEKSRMGLPEVGVGLFPAGGGTQTLSKVVGFKTALNLIVNGRIGSAKDYGKTSLVSICDSADLLPRAVSWLEGNQGIKNRNYDPDFQEPDTLSFEEKKEILTAARARYGQCPSRPYLIAALDSLENGLNSSHEEAARDDVELFVRLFEHPNVRNKIDLFFLVSSLGPKLARVDAKKALSVNTLAIIGSGLMGRGIAQVAADKGIRTLLLDVDEKSSQQALATIKTSIDGLVDKGRWSAQRRDRAIDNLIATADFDRLAEVPLAIECVFEDLPLKRRIVAQVQQINPSAVFASNTSTLPMAEIAKEAACPERIVGMHFFSPVPLMPLLEVICGPQSSPEAVATAVTVGRTMGKTVIVVGDGPGFYTSRTFGSFVMTGFRLAELGVSPWDVDLLGLRAGFPQGPLHIYGTAGGNVIYHAGKYLHSQLPGHFFLSETLVNMYKAGFVGAGQPCFYLDDRTMTPNEATLDHIAPIRGIPKPTDKETMDILLLSMVNEAFWCLSNDVLKDYYSMDLGAVLGIGFPDCWHGPARYVSLKGVAATRARLNELAEKFQLSNLMPAPEFDRLTACGLDSNLI